MFAGELPWQIDWSDDAVPPTLVGLTITVTVVEFVDVQVPLITTAR